jgi:hypothetical protein
MKFVKEKFQNFIVKLGIIGELSIFLWEHKLWWAIPVILILIIITFILVLVGNTGLAAFIYPLF